MCFYVLSSGRIKERARLQKTIHRSIYNPKYLAFLVSRAIYKAVFLVPKLDAKVFKKMLFDYFDEKVIKMLQISLSFCIYVFNIS